MYGYYYDPTYLLLLPAIVLSLYAQFKVKSTFAKYSSRPSARGINGAQAAQMVMKGRCTTGIARVSGSLTDHYDPRSNTLRLSDSVYGSTSLAALGVAAHEAGHALQYADQYGPIRLRTLLLPAAQFGSTAAWPLMLAGLVLSFDLLVSAGIVVFSCAVLFQLITLPVEFNASRRALEALESEGILSRDELPAARKVLSAAALTYLAAALTSVMQLLRLIMIARKRK